MCNTHKIIASYGELENKLLVNWSLNCSILNDVPIKKLVYQFNIVFTIKTLISFYLFTETININIIYIINGNVWKVHQHLLIYLYNRYIYPNYIYEINSIFYYK